MSYSYISCVILIIVRVGEMPWPKTGATHYHAHLGLLDRGRGIKVLLFYWMLPQRGQNPFMGCKSGSQRGEGV